MKKKIYLIQQGDGDIVPYSYRVDKLVGTRTPEVNKVLTQEQVSALILERFTTVEIRGK